MSRARADNTPCSTCIDGRQSPIPSTVSNDRPGPCGNALQRITRLSEIRYFSRRQFTEPLVSTVLDSASMSKPRLSRYFSVRTEPLPTIETP